MRIEIETDGSHAGTKIVMNEQAVETAEFSLSTRKTGRVKLQMQRARPDGSFEFISYYGDDFQKIDECKRINQEAQK